MERTPKLRNDEGTFRVESEGRALTKWRRNGARAQAEKTRSTEVPEIGTVSPDPLLAAA
jgi:hypothetical protein